MRGKRSYLHSHGTVALSSHARQHFRSLLFSFLCQQNGILFQSSVFAIDISQLHHHIAVQILVKVSALHEFCSVKCCTCYWDQTSNKVNQCRHSRVKYDSGNDVTAMWSAEEGIE